MRVCDAKGISVLTGNNFTVIARVGEVISLIKITTCYKIRLRKSFPDTTLFGIANQS